MPRIHHIYKDPTALERDEKTSDARELYIDSHTLVDLHIEMSVAEAWVIFNHLPVEQLSPLPHGYQWVEANDKYSVIRSTSAREHELLLVLYGPDEKNQINFIFLVDGHTTYSHAHTRNGQEPARRYPMTNNDYKVPTYDYSQSKYKSHVRGHLIDHKDTIIELLKEYSSTYDARNYVPEPPNYDWGFGIRRLEVDHIRDNGGGTYTQLNDYPSHPSVTKDGTSVPENVHFSIYPKNTASEILNVQFTENLSRPAGKKILDHARSTFFTSKEASPVAQRYLPTDSDRVLRYQSRTAQTREANIRTGNVYSRFPQVDSFFAACEAGDFEFESPARRLHAGIVSYQQHNVTLGYEYLDNSLSAAEQLEDILDGKNLFPKDIVVEAKTFFQDADETEELDNFQDMFSRLSTSP